MLERKRRTWPRWSLPGAIVLVVIVSLWSLRHQPTSTLMDHVPALFGSQVSHVLKDTRAMTQDARGSEPSCLAWRIHLHVDPSLRPPGPEWIMFEGETCGRGYELHWLPDRLALQIIRAPERLLLGTVLLKDLPEDVAFVRHGPQLQVWVNGQNRLSCIDPAGNSPAPSAWGFRATGAMKDGSSLSLFDDSARLSADEKTAALWPDAAAKNSPNKYTSDDDIRRFQKLPLLLQVRQALFLDPLSRRSAADVALDSALASVLNKTNIDPNKNSLLSWLDWGKLRLDLYATSAVIPDRAHEIAASLEHLDALARVQHAPENLGLFLNLLPLLAEKACGRSQLPRAPAAVLRERDAWLQLLRQAGQAALRLDEDHGRLLPDRWRWQLRLCLHAAQCFMHNAPDPLPAEAPDWVVSRWRTLAGNGPGGPVFSGDIPVSTDEQNPILPVLMRLLDHAAIDPTAAEGTARLIELMENYEAKRETLDAAGQLAARTDCDAMADTIIKTMPERQAILARALFVFRRLVLQDLVDAEKALMLLDPPEIREARLRDSGHNLSEANRPLAPIESDPLAYAFYRLLLARLANPELSPDIRRRIVNPINNPSGLPETHATFSSLLSGRPEATSYAWKVDPTILPPPQALAAALAMQEAAGLTCATTSDYNVEGLPQPPADGSPRVYWRLLDRTLCLTVPLRFLLPTSATVPGAIPAGDGTKPNLVP